LKRTGQNKNNRKVCLLGASFTTGNMGVSALADSSIKIIINRWPDAEITIIGGGYAPQQQRLSIMGKELNISTFPVRFSKNIFLPYHFLWFTFYGVLSKLLPNSRFKSHFIGRNIYFKVLYEADVVVDITGGDSFSDIYGFRRFFRGFLYKWLVIFLGKQLVLLPQTYGPFKKKLTKRMARYVMRHASIIYSRDRVGMEYTRQLLNLHKENGKIRFAPDVAFVLDAHEPEKIRDDEIQKLRTKNSVAVGLNISGLLFNGGYTQDNMFGLKTDYKELVSEIIKLLLKHDKVVFFLIPHVFPPKGLGLEIESDSEACRQVYEQMHGEYPGRIFFMQGAYDHNEIKYLIGKCDFFIGSRMHSCIAALSQCIAAVGLAYSKKFRGVFESVDVEKFAIDICNAEKEEVLSTVETAFEHRQETASRLRDTIPKIQQQLLGVFNDIS
jgi:colanic acid/amylovoran biosynthesis protein